MKWLLLFVVAALGGCGTMTVHVDVLDRTTNPIPFVLPGVMDKEQQVSNNRSIGAYAAKQQELSNTIHAAIAQGTSLSTRPGDLIVSLDTVKPLEQAMDNDVTTTFSEALKYYDQGLASMQTFRQLKPERLQERQQALLSAQAAFATGDSEIADLSSKLAHRLNQLQRFTPKADNNAATQAALDKFAMSEGKDIVTAAEDVGRSLVAYEILDDPAAPAIVGASNDDWKPHFNRTFGFGLIGNTDIAVQMRGVGDYTIKGVRLDAAKATQATFDGVHAAVSIAAAAYGIPVPLPNASSSTASTATTATLGTTVQTSTQQLQSAQDVQHAAHVAELNILDALVIQGTIVQQDPPKAASLSDTAKQAVKIISATYQANRPNLDPSASK
ncbi:MAG TPA: hypothetical protein VG722_13390 [Tepidisphaeraceae bacterium]|jgi:hypothetical protein|nr:hypothetical protein [Tepidisphaeraceae bacterium]